MAHIKRIIYDNTYVNIPEEPWVETVNMNGVETEVTCSYAHSFQAGVMQIGIMDEFPPGNMDGEVDIHNDEFLLNFYGGSTPGNLPEAMVTIFRGSPTEKFSNGLVWIIKDGNIQQ